MTLRVTRSKKDIDGDIIGLGGNGWSHTKTQAVANIRRDPRYYHVLVSGKQVYMRIATRNNCPYLTTSPDGFSPNNLDDLPDC